MPRVPLPIGRGTDRLQTQIKNVGFYQLVGLELDKLTGELERIVADHKTVILDMPGESVGGFATKLAMNRTGYSSGKRRTTKLSLHGPEPILTYFNRL
jgi:hypothetical protein